MTLKRIVEVKITGKRQTGKTAIAKLLRAVLRACNISSEQKTVSDFNEINSELITINNDTLALFPPVADEKVSPAPWELVAADKKNTWRIVAANGQIVANLTSLDMDNGKYIVDVVNFMHRMRYEH